MTVTDLLQRIQDIARVRYAAEPQPRFVLNPRGEQELSIGVDLTTLERSLDDLSRKSISDLSLYDNTSIELLVREESGSPVYARSRGDDLKIHDPDSEIEYALSPPSNLYIIFLIDQLIESGISPNYLRPRLIPLNMLRDRFLRTEDPPDIFDYLRFTTLRYPTVKISTTARRTLAQFQTLITSFAFQLGYNLDLALVPQRSVIEFARGARLASFRRANSESIDPPRREYLSDLVYHYQMGLSAENPFVAFLSYYHVAEHFFEKVFNDDLIDAIKDKITQPGFSYRRRKDVQGLIADVKKAFQFRSEYVTFNELEALTLTLKKYCPVQELAVTVKAFDEILFNYLRQDFVIFSDGPPIPWDDPDPNSCHKALAKRLYLTRNALVHSKESDKKRYTPFKDDEVLAKEVPLMRFIAESIIAKTSTILE